jgi:hypothetical protein
MIAIHLNSFSIRNQNEEDRTYHRSIYLFQHLYEYRLVLASQIQKSARAAHNSS